MGDVKKVTLRAGIQTIQVFAERYEETVHATIFADDGRDVAYLLDVPLVELRDALTALIDEVQ